MKTVAENRSELGDHLGQAICQKPGSRRNQRVFNERAFDGEHNCVTDREKSTTQIDYGCQLVDDRVPPHHSETDTSISEIVTAARFVYKYVECRVSRRFSIRL